MDSKSLLKFFFADIIPCLLIATLLRWGVGEISTVPTGSMERTIMPDDYVVLSKLHYGPRITMTPLQVPLTHQKTHLLKIKSYLEWIKIPYFRFPGFSKVKRNDIVSFNYPAEIFLPIDIRTFYIKRCVGLPGDEIKMINNKVYINNEEIKNCEKSIAQYSFSCEQILPESFFKTHGINTHFYKDASNEYIVELEEKQKKDFLKENSLPNIKLCSKRPTTTKLFIEAANYKDITNWGPIKIPNKGMKININKETIALYGNTIVNYDHNENKCEIRDNELYIDGKKIDEYIFKQDYFFMIGDNRHDSIDSRSWGFVPEDHIYGKCIFIFNFYMLVLIIILILLLFLFQDKIFLFIIETIKKIKKSLFH